MNVAEIELNVLSRECLSQMIPDKQPLKTEIAASQTGVVWQFTTEDARTTILKTTAF